MVIKQTISKCAEYYKNADYSCNIKLHSDILKKSTILYLIDLETATIWQSLPQPRRLGIKLSWIQATGII